MARQTTGTAKKKVSGGLLFRVMILLLLCALGWTLHSVQTQVRAAEEEKAEYVRQVTQIQQDNEALRADIAEGATDEKLRELARDELGWAAPDEYVFYDRSN